MSKKIIFILTLVVLVFSGHTTINTDSTTNNTVPISVKKPTTQLSKTEISSSVKAVGDLSELISKYGFGTTITAIFQLVFLIWVWRVLVPSMKTKTDKDRNLGKILEDLLVEIQTNRKEHTAMLNSLTIISHRYSDRLSYDHCARIFKETTQSTMYRLVLKLETTIRDNNIIEQWTRIEIKIKEFVISQFNEDMALLKQFRLDDESERGTRLSSFFDETQLEDLTTFCLLAVKGKYAPKEVEDGLENIYRRIFNDFLMKTKKPI